MVWLSSLGFFQAVSDCGLVIFRVWRGERGHLTGHSRQGFSLLIGGRHCNNETSSVTAGLCDGNAYLHLPFSYRRNLAFDCLVTGNGPIVKSRSIFTLGNCRPHQTGSPEPDYVSTGPDLQLIILFCREAILAGSFADIGTFRSARKSRHFRL